MASGAAIAALFLGILLGLAGIIGGIFLLNDARNKGDSQAIPWVVIGVGIFFVFLGLLSFFLLDRTPVGSAELKQQ